MCHLMRRLWPVALNNNNNNNNNNNDYKKLYLYFISI